MVCQASAYNHHLMTAAAPQKIIQYQYGYFHVHCGHNKKELSGYIGICEVTRQCGEFSQQHIVGRPDTIPCENILANKISSV